MLFKDHNSQFNWNVNFGKFSPLYLELKCIIPKCLPGAPVEGNLKTCARIYRRTDGCSM